MRRAAASLRWDLVRQYRSGFYLVSILLIPIVGGALRLSGAGAAQLRAMPFIVVMLLLVTTFYFSAAILLLEKGEGTLQGLAVTPLRTSEYLAARTLSLTLLAAAETLAILFVGFGPLLRPIALLPGIVALCALNTLIGTALVTRYESINEFLLPSAGVLIVLVLPLITELGYPGGVVMALHPLYPGLLLLRAAVAPADPLAVAGAAAAASLWTAFAYLLAHRALQRFRVRATGS